MINTILQRSFNTSQKRIQAAISFTAEEKYLNFLKTYPDIATRIPQSMIASYLGISATQKFDALGKALFGKVETFKMNPQAIADGVLKLVNMEQGKRPLRYPIDAIAQGTDLEFIESRAAIKVKWLSKYAD
jgi:hypothetical protein